MENRESLKNKNNILKKNTSTIIAFPNEIVMYRNKQIKIHPLLLQILRVKNYQYKINAKELEKLN